jgi:hypothetical protein
MQVFHESGHKNQRMESYMKKRTVIKGSDRSDAAQKQGVFCICPSCGERVLRSNGTHCYQKTCPTCSVTMVRDWQRES